MDAAFYLQANTFRGNTTLQLQLVDVRPSLLPSRNEAEALALVGRLTEEDGPISPQEALRLRASRSQYAACWLALEKRLRQGKAEEDRLPYLRRLAGCMGGSESFLRSALALEVFRERGLISMTRQGDRLTLCLVPIQGKVDLTACPYLLRLQEKEAT